MLSWVQYARRNRKVFRCVQNCVIVRDGSCTNRERQRVPQWQTRDEKTSLSVSRCSCSRYRQIAVCCRSEMTSASGGRNRVAHHCKVGWCRLVKTLENQQTDLALQATILRVWVGGYPHAKRSSYTFDLTSKFFWPKYSSLHKLSSVIFRTGKCERHEVGEWLLSNVSGISGLGRKCYISHN